MTKCTAVSPSLCERVHLLSLLLVWVSLPVPFPLWFNSCLQSTLACELQKTLSDLASKGDTLPAIRVFLEKDVRLATEGSDVGMRFVYLHFKQAP